MTILTLIYMEISISAAKSHPCSLVKWVDYSETVFGLYSKFMHLKNTINLFQVANPNCLSSMTQTYITYVHVQKKQIAILAIINKTGKQTNS